MKRNIKRFALVLFLYALTGGLVAAQRPTHRPPFSVKRTEGKPAVYISFERIAKRTPVRQDERLDGVWLRLNNNMKFAIRACTFGISETGVPLIAPDAKSQLGLKYDVEVVNSTLFNPARQRVPSGYAFGTSCVEDEIRPGGYLSFSVPKEHLAEGLAIKVPFEYEWEPIGGGYTQHFVYFPYTSIPGASK